MNEDAQREPIHGLDAASLTLWRPCARTLRREHFGLDSQLCLALALSTTSATCLYISVGRTRTQEPRHASAPWHASVVLLPATPPALPCAVAAHSSALRPGAACCPRTFYAPPPGLSRTAPCWPGPPRATQTSSARCCAQGPRAHASPAEARRAVRPTFVGSLRYCTRPLCPRAGDAGPGLQRNGKSYGQISATFPRENGMHLDRTFCVNCPLHESPKTSPRSLIR